jgi:hypothetical protein
MTINRTTPLHRTHPHAAAVPRCHQREVEGKQDKHTFSRTHARVANPMQNGLMKQYGWLWTSRWLE